MMMKDVFIISENITDFEEVTLIIGNIRNSLALDHWVRGVGIK